MSKTETTIRSTESIREAQAALCAVIGKHDYRPAMGLWAATGRVGTPRWYCTRCGADRPPLTDRERVENLMRFLDEEPASDE